MRHRLPVLPAPGPLAAYAQAFDALFPTRTQCAGFRRSLEGLLLPTERHKTLTGLAHTEPVVGAQHPTAQRLPWGLTESTWAPEVINQRRLALLRQTPHLVPHAHGVLVIDETGHRQWGTKTARVGRQYRGSIGKIDHGAVSVRSLWADDRVDDPLAVEPYTPAHWFPKGTHDAALCTKPTTRNCSPFVACKIWGQCGLSPRRQRGALHYGLLGDMYPNVDFRHTARNGAMRLYL
jgi:SRSO17 transposase